MRSKLDRLQRIFGVFAIFFGQCFVYVRAMEETGMQETSDAYLRNVVSELQFLSGSVPSASASSSDISYDDNSHIVYENTPRPTRTSVHFVESMENLQSPSIKKYDLQAQVMPNNLAYMDEEPVPPSPIILKLTATQLAAMYKKAIERGTPLNYNSFMNTINHQRPKIIPAPVEVYDENRHQPEPSPYAYYFYPLQTFQHKLTDNQGYRTVPDLKHDLIPAENKKETSTMYPVLVGVSSFLGMALLFVLSLFVYPRFMHYMHFPLVTTSRTAFENELSYLANFVIEAIDYYNSIRKNSNRLSKFVNRS